MKKTSIIIGLLIAVNAVFSQNSSQYISQTAPSEVSANEVFTATVTFKNTSAIAWTTATNYRVGTQSPQDNTLWGFNRVQLPHDVAPGEEVTFTKELTAPGINDPYGYSLQWRMVQDGVEWFGDKSELRSIIVGIDGFSDSLLTSTNLFSVNSHVVGTSVFHWYGAHAGQLISPWIALEGRENWTGEVPFWKRMIKQSMAANIDVYYILVIPTMEQERINLFRALNELRREGWDVPKVCPFFDPIITYTIKGVHGTAATIEGKDEIVSHYIRFYNQYYSQNTDEFADDFIYTQDDIPVLDVWHVHLHIDYYAAMTRENIESRLSAEFGDEHPIFNNGIKMITNAISPTFSFADEKVHQFEEQKYKIDKLWNGVTTSLLKPGYWDQNVRNPGYFLPRDGGVHYKDSWNSVNSNSEIDRVNIESFNEYDEGSGIYATKTDTIYRKTDGGMNNTEMDTWSSTNDPYEYIKTTAAGAAIFNDIDELGAKILWHNIPQVMDRTETFMATVIVRNTDDETWNAENDFMFGELETEDPVMFGSGRYLIDDTKDDILDYGGIFRGRAKTFTIEVTAPDETGDYLTHWGMLQEGVAWFGDVLEVPISVSESYYNIDFESLCIGDSILWHDDYYSVAGLYYDSSLTVGGLDSIHRLDLSITSIDPSVTQNDAKLSANYSGAMYQWIDCATSEFIEGETSQNFTTTVDGSYAVIITDGDCVETSECYSVIGVEYESLCIGDSMLWHDDYYSVAGLYYDSLLTVGGHDSIYRLDLKIISIDPSVTNSEEKFKASYDGANYQWINCATSEAIEGETSQYFTATENGDYAVIITDGECVDTSLCYSATGVGIMDLNGNVNQFKTYPNPVSKNGTLNIEGDFGKNDRLVIFGINGNIVYQESILNDIEKIHLSPQANNMKEGVYIIQIISNQNITTKKILISR